MIAPKPSDDLWAFAAEQSRLSTEAERRADEARENLVRVRAELETTQEWKDVEDAKAALKEERDAALAARADLIQAEKDKVKALRKELRKVATFKTAKALKAESKALDEQSAIHGKAATRAISKGAVPKDTGALLSSQLGVDVVVAGRVRENVAGA